MIQPDLELIQPDFSIKLNGIQLLKKFSSPYMGEDIIADLEMFDNFCFFLQINKTKIEIVPFITNEELQVIISNPLNYNILKQFIIFQLINSGTLPFLRNIPLNKVSSEMIMFTFLTFKKTNNTAEMFHNDSMLFNILRYHTPDNTPVLGSNILFHDQRNFRAHSGMESDGSYHQSYAGELLSNSQNLISDIYTMQHLNPVVLRGLYNSGDTLVLNDMLVKHSAISTEERYNRDTKIMTIDVAHDFKTTEELTVTVCDHQINPTPEDLLNRRLVGIFIEKFNPFIYDIDVFEGEIKIRPVYSFTLDEKIDKLPIDELQFSTEDYLNFLEKLYSTHYKNECGSFTINKDETLQIFRLRGGKTNKRRKVSKKKQRKKTLYKKSFKCG